MEPEIAHETNGTKIVLPLSKSISNRLLVIRALLGEVSPMEQLSDGDDTYVMVRALQSEDQDVDIGHAGTAMRFLTAFFAQKEGGWTITGSERMKQRPIQVLVEALTAIGGRITYLGQVGYPPLQIEGTSLRGGELEIAASVSSQYISALLLIAPYMKQGLRLKLQGEVVSNAYINMTLRMMQIFGAEVNRRDNSIWVAPIPYQSTEFQVEADWSAASYFFALSAVARCQELRLIGLHADSIQGDSGQMELWKRLGVDPQFVDGELKLSPKAMICTFFEADLIEMPDLIPSFAVVCCLLDLPFRLRGIETLRIKETDRVAALVAELKKLGYLLQEEKDSCLSWLGEKCTPDEQPVIQTYQDHRMAMAFAVAALKFPGLSIANRAVVSKSFPRFWEEWEKIKNDNR